MSTMNEIDLKTIKDLSLSMIKDIAAFCDEHSLRYYLAYGTMLGAVRHHGFIPWDDDVDLMMPRPDYEKFVSLYNQSNARYQVYSIDTTEEYTYTMAKVFDTHTMMVDKTLWKPFPMAGVFVDIFPMDGLPEGEQEQAKHFDKQQWLNLLFRGSAMKFTFSNRYADSKSQFATLKVYVRTLLKFGAITLMHALPTTKLIHKINDSAKKYDYETSKFVSIVVDCDSENKREVYPKELFDKRVKYPFEDTEVYGVEDYDFYLTHLYNEYMVAPPADRCVPHHNYNVYWREEEVE